MGIRKLLGLECKYKNKCPIYKRLIKQGVDPTACNTNFAQDYYGFGRSAGCYRDMEKHETRNKR